MFAAIRRACGERTTLSCPLKSRARSPVGNPLVIVSDRKVLLASPSSLLTATMRKRLVQNEESFQQRRWALHARVGLGEQFMSDCKSITGSGEGLRGRRTIPPPQVRRAPSQYLRAAPKRNKGWKSNPGTFISSGRTMTSKRCSRRKMRLINRTAHCCNATGLVHGRVSRS